MLHVIRLLQLLYHILVELLFRFEFIDLPTFLLNVNLIVLNCLFLLFYHFADGFNAICESFEENLPVTRAVLVNLSCVRFPALVAAEREDDFLKNDVRIFDFFARLCQLV